MQRTPFPEKMVTTRSPGETMRLASRFARHLAAGSVVALQGPLGSGKTTFTKGLARGLGFSETRRVSSPTFVLLHVYPGRVNLYHFDAYRIRDENDLRGAGLDALPKGVLVIEWAERVRSLLSPPYWTVEFRHSTPTVRRIRFSYHLDAHFRGPARRSRGPARRSRGPARRSRGEASRPGRPRRKPRQSKNAQTGAKS